MSFQRMDPTRREGLTKSFNSRLTLHNARMHQPTPSRYRVSSLIFVDESQLGPCACPGHVVFSTSSHHASSLVSSTSDQFARCEANLNSQANCSPDNFLRISTNQFKKRGFNQDSGMEEHLYSRNQGFQNPGMGYFCPVNEHEKWYEDIDLSLYDSFFYSSTEAASANRSIMSCQNAHWINQPFMGPAHFSIQSTESSENFMAETSYDFDGTLQKNKKVLLPSPDIGESNRRIQNTRPGKRFCNENHANRGCQIHPTNTEYPRSINSPASSTQGINYTPSNLSELNRPENVPAAMFHAHEGGRRSNHYASCPSVSGSDSTMYTLNQEACVQGGDGNLPVKRPLLPNPIGRRTLLPTPAACRPSFT